MAWDHLAINKPHLVYIILGGFTSLFMLCSSIIKEKLYIGEATVATLVGVIFGPHAANLINPMEWGNTDQITLEFSRIILVVQCFAVGVELPKHYMEKHWRSVVFLLVPVMTFGWLVTSLFIWAMFYEHANWLDCLCIAACVTATDPVLASSVVGKGKFSKRVPKHLRDILSAESGCNDGMAFPFIYLALYIIKYKGEPSQVALHWFCYTILYECIFGCFFGVAVGYIARQMIRYAHERNYIDRESFLVFYFVLALFCAGSGSLLGMDDLLIGFACGVGFSNDGWFSEKTEEAHVSNVIDLLLNLAFFVYFGTIIPWDHYNSGFLGLDAWRLVVIALLVVFFRRIPAMLALKPLIPDVKTWREALFAGHFGPIGVGAIFVAILARADLEEGPQDGATPLAVLPPQNFEHANIIELIWPITTFLVMTSIVVHGSSIAVFTLGKHINTLALTMSYSRAPDEPNWMDRLPRIQSRSKTNSMSIQRSDSDVDNEKQMPGNMLPLAAAGNFLRRQRESDPPAQVSSRSSSRHRSRRSKGWDGRGPGGPISASAISPAIRPKETNDDDKQWRSDSDTLALKNDSSPSSEEKDQEKAAAEQDQSGAETPAEIYEEGQDTVYEDKEGEVLAVEHNDEAETKLEREASEVEESKRLGHHASARDESPDEGPPGEGTVGDSIDKSYGVTRNPEDEKDSPAKVVSDQAGKRWRDGMRKMSVMGMLGKKDGAEVEEKPPQRKQSEARRESSAPARAYQYGNTIILEDEDGEVIKKYEIPVPEGEEAPSQGGMKRFMGGMGKRFGFGGHDGKIQAGAPAADRVEEEASAPQPKPRRPTLANIGGDDDDDELVRFTTGGRRMSKIDFINSFADMDPKRRLQAVEASGLPEAEKREARKEAREQAGLTRTTSRADVPNVPELREEEEEADEQGFYTLGRQHTAYATELQRQQSRTGEVPFHDVSRDLRTHQMRGRDGEETAAERRRRLALQQPAADSDSDDDGTERVPPSGRPGPSSRDRSSSEAEETAADRRRRLGVRAPSPPHNIRQPSDTGETAAERRRRLGALGHSREVDSGSEEDDVATELPQPKQQQAPVGDYFAPQPSPAAAPMAEPSRPKRTLRWASNVGRK